MICITFQTCKQYYIWFRDSHVHSKNIKRVLEACNLSEIIQLYVWENSEANQGNKCTSLLYLNDLFYIK